MKNTKRIVSFLLSAIMVVTTFLAVGPVFTIEAEAADITIGGITQKRVVENYEETYRKYQSEYFQGAETNWPTNFVIPGLGTEDYTPQGMTYWHEKEWILISAYDAGSGTKNSVIYVLDAKTTDFIALFKIKNSNDTVNLSHGGGIAASEYNFYYADSDSKISYWPLDYMDIEIDPDYSKNVKEITIVDSIDCSAELNGVKTSYCCYDDGVLWTGNFYFAGDDRYKASFNSSYDSALMGYRLKGDSSDEEWYNLKNQVMTQSNLLKPIKTGDLTASKTENSLAYNVSVDSNGYIDIVGDATFVSGNKENCPYFARAYLFDGANYKLEFDLRPDSSATGGEMFMTDVYFINEGSTGKGFSNIKSTVGTSAMTKTDNGDGTYHFALNFTVGERLPGGGDGNWHTLENLGGNYKVRFDIDAITANRHFEITNIRLNKVDSEYTVSETLGEDCAGNPTHVVLTDMDKIQYAMVDKGKIYISRSWSRYDSTNHIRELAIGDIDINTPGTEKHSVAGVERWCHIVKDAEVDESGSKFYGDTMLWMGEALCVIDDYLYMFGESAAYSYRVEKSNDHVCEYPIDVIWKIDQHKINQVDRPTGDADLQVSHYERVNNIGELKSGEEYLIVYESEFKDPVTQKNALYLLDSFGGYGDNKLPKNDSPGTKNTGDSIGAIGYKVNYYTLDGDTLYIDDKIDARKSVRWKVTHEGNGTKCRIQNMDFYYGSNKYLYFDHRFFTMSTSGNTMLDNMSILDKGAGDSKFYILNTTGGVPYYLWCNEGSDPNGTYLDAYTNYYASNTVTEITPNYQNLEEIPGTFHTDGLNLGTSTSGNRLGQAVYKYDLGEFYFFKRVPDPHAEVGSTKIYSDFDAELQSDGTYDITIETYATSALHYKKLPDNVVKPTDYVFVMDTSNSMSGSAAGIVSFVGDMAVKDICSDYSIAIDRGVGYTAYDISNGQEEYYRDANGNYHPMRAAVRYHDSYFSWGQKRIHHYWLYYVNQQDGLYYMIQKNGTASTTGITASTLQSYLDSNSGWILETTENTATNRKENIIYDGPHYTIETRSGDEGRLYAAREYLKNLVEKIGADADERNLDHRIAFCNFQGTPTVENTDGNHQQGTLTGFFTTSSTNRQTIPWGYVDCTDSNGNSLYKNAFHDRDQFSNITDILNKFGSVSGYGYGGGSDMSYGMHMANMILRSTGEDYTYTGDRHACVIVVTDGGVTVNDAVHTAEAAKSAASSAISRAYEIKKQGAYIYTMRVSHQDIADFDEDAFLSYLSMDYGDAKNYNDIGDPNPSQVDYSYVMNLTGSTISTYETEFLNSVEANAKYCLAKLDTTAILREKLNTNVFKIIEGVTDIQAGTIDAYYDGLDRLKFDEDAGINSSGISANLDWNEGLFTVSGFDYTKHYVSTQTAKEGTAKKLVIKVTGVTINPNIVNTSDLSSDYVNVDVDDPTPTGLYQNSERMAANDKHKAFPSDRITIPQYTYVLDYGIPMYDPHVNGKIVAVTTTMGQVTDPQKTLPESYGVSVDGTTVDSAGFNDLLYGVKPNCKDPKCAYVLIQRPDDTYDWFRLNIVPASNVYYEEGSMKIKSASADAVDWTLDGTPKITTQTLTDYTDVYGYDNEYKNNNYDFSNNTAYKAVLNADNRTSETMTFTFDGTGFDIYSACGNNTGVQIIAIRDESGALKKSYVIDTYYNQNVYNTRFTQIPILHYEVPISTDAEGNTVYTGKYTVEVTAAYLPSLSGALKAQSIESQIIDENGIVSYTTEFDDSYENEILRELGFEELIGTDVEFISFSEDSVLNGGEGPFAVDVDAFTTQSVTQLENYIDGFRVYNNFTSNTGYYVDAEKGMTQYYNVMNVLNDKEADLNIYYETEQGSSLIPVKYNALGVPKNEFYLTNSSSNSLAFKVPDWASYYRVMVSARAASGNPQLRVNSSVAINSLTKAEMYYDITDYVGENGEIAISNAGDGLLALNNIKVVDLSNAPVTSFDIQSMSVEDVQMIMDLPTVEVELNAPKKPEIITPDTPDIPGVEIPDGDDVTPPSDNDNPEEPAEDGFFAKVESFFVKIFNFFKNIFNKVFSFFEF